MQQQDKYRQLSKEHDLPVFFQPWWLDMTGKKWDVAIAEDMGKPVAVWPYTAEKKAGIAMVRNPLLTPYLGPVALGENGKLTDTQLEQLWQQMPHPPVFDVQCLPGTGNPDLFRKEGLEVAERVTYLLEMEMTEEQLFKKIKDSRRSVIRKAAKDLEVVDGLPLLDMFFGLHRDTFARKDTTYPYTPAFFKKLIKTSVENGCGRLLAAKDNEGNTSAFVFVVYDARNCYLLLTAMDPQHQHSGGVSLLIWQAIKFAREKGLKIFDFEGSMDAGIATFFRSFGGDKVHYYSYSVNNSVVWKLKKKLLG